MGAPPSDSGSRHFSSTLLSSLTTTERFLGSPGTSAREGSEWLQTCYFKISTSQHKCWWLKLTEWRRHNDRSTLCPVTLANFVDSTHMEVVRLFRREVRYRHFELVSGDLFAKQPSHWVGITLLNQESCQRNTSITFWLLPSDSNTGFADNLHFNITWLRRNVWKSGRHF